MIFVITGTRKEPFNRLIREINSIAQTGKDNFVVQLGYSSYIPVHCRYFTFCNNDMFLSYIKGAEIVISHPGFGSIGHCIKHNKPMILVPREQKYDEVNHNQHELAEHLADENDSIVCIRDIKLLPEAIQELKSTLAKYDYHTNIPVLIEDFVHRNLLR